LILPFTKALSHIYLYTCPSLYALNNNPSSPSFPDGLPPLPEITDQTLLTQTFTHRSYLQRPVTSFMDSSQPRDYESLEHLGDSVLNLGVTDLLRRLYPDLRPGGATLVRSKIINNANLASIANRYSFGTRVHINVTQEAVLREAESVLADVFEAYIGAVYTERGFERTTAWLANLLTPYAQLAYSEALVEHNAPLSNGSLMRLNELLQRAGMPPVHWMDYEIKSATGGSSWKLDAIVNQQLVGTGVATSKARAKNIAAEEALKVLENPSAPPESPLK